MGRNVLGFPLVMYWGCICAVPTAGAIVTAKSLAIIVQVTPKVVGDDQPGV